MTTGLAPLPDPAISDPYPPESAAASPGQRPPRVFLTADWTNVVLANYRVDPALLQPHVPPGSELDTPDGQPDLHLLSLVAFRFSRMRVYGIAVPTARDFPEVNVRFYVRRGPMRAVVFLREFVPPRLVVFGARFLYHQPYCRAAISHRVTPGASDLQVQSTIIYRGVRGEIDLRAQAEPITPPAGSLEHFLIEHYWGFDRTRRGQSFRYRVDHPPWRTHAVEAATSTVSPGHLLGGAWAEIDWESAFHSIVFAAGSRAVVYWPEPLVD